MYFLAISHDHQVSYQSSLISSSVCDMRRTSHTPDNIRDVAGGVSAAGPLFGAALRPAEPIDGVRGICKLPNEVRAILDQGKRFGTAVLALLVEYLF